MYAFSSFANVCGLWKTSLSDFQLAVKKKNQMCLYDGYSSATVTKYPRI